MRASGFLLRPRRNLHRGRTGGRGGGSGGGWGRGGATWKEGNGGKWGRRGKVRGEGREDEGQGWENQRRKMAKST
ncbi:unnamed protein product [Closterium sp. NIES-54]